MLEKYLKSFSTLRTAKNKKGWSALTCHQAPHKPFLLLSVLDLVAQGSITDNLIKPSFELVEIFNLYWTTIMPAGSRGLISYPFYHMRTEDFWELRPNPGYKDQPGLTISSMTKLRKIYAGACIDDDLFQTPILPRRSTLSW
jgi:putative restriction endonuclease